MLTRMTPLGVIASSTSQKAPVLNQMEHGMQTNTTAAYRPLYTADPVADASAFYDRQEAEAEAHEAASAAVAEQIRKTFALLPGNRFTSLSVPCTDDTGQKETAVTLESAVGDLLFDADPWVALELLLCAKPDTVTFALDSLRKALAERWVSRWADDVAAVRGEA